MTPLVTVIIPVFKVEEYLDACLQSVVTQDHEPLQIILVDDASPDSSGDLCDTWAARDPRIQVIHQTTNAGSSVARNAGIEVATGDYLSFIDSDDVVSPHLVSRMVAQATAADADVVISGLIEFVEGTPQFSLAGEPRVAPASEILHHIICERPRWSPWAKLYRRSLFDAGLRFPVGLLHQDLHMAPRALASAGTVVLSDDALYGYRQRPGSVMNQRRTHSVSVDLVTVLTSNIEFARTHCTSLEEFQQYLAAYLIHASEQLEETGRGAAWRRNAPFRRAYRRMARRYLPEMLRCSHVSPAYRALWGISAVSPVAFRELFRLGATLKRTILPRISRHVAP